MKRYLLARMAILSIVALGAACQHTTAPTPVESSIASLPKLAILDAVMARQVDGDYAPIDVTDQFAPDEAFYCTIQVADVQPDTILVARWRFGDELIHESVFTVNEPGSGYVAFELTSERPWPEGNYRVEISSGEVLLRLVQFRVAESVP